MVKNLPANAADTGDVGSTLVWEDPLDQEMATHSRILAWKNPINKGGWQAMAHGVAESDTAEHTHTHTTHW